MTKKRCFSCRADKVFPDDFNAQGKICLECHRLRERARRDGDRDAYNKQMRAYRAKRRADRPPKLREPAKGRDKERERRRKREYYAQNLQSFMLRNAHTKAERSQIIRDIKRANVCARCGFADFRCLTFHHLRDKEFEISEAPSMRISVERLMKEIAKCIILCANCHLIEHYIER